MPTLSIHTSFVPTPEAVVTVAGRGEIAFLRDRPLPLLRLHRLYQVEDAKTDPTEALVLVVSDSKGRETALLVDGLLGQQHLVVKSLNTMLGDVPGVSGTAILGNGRVALVIDPTSIIRWAQQHRTASAA